MAKQPRPIVGPERVPQTRSIYCRSCAKECSRRVDGTWRHDHDGSTLADTRGEPGRCPSPDAVAGYTRT